MEAIAFNGQRGKLRRACRPMEILEEFVKPMELLVLGELVRPMEMLEEFVRPMELLVLGELVRPNKTCGQHIIRNLKFGTVTDFDNSFIWSGQKKFRRSKTKFFNYDNSVSDRS